MPTLNWIGKAAVVTHHKDVPYRLLEPVPELSCLPSPASGRGAKHASLGEGLSNGDEPSANLIVQGDNLQALKALLPRYAGQVKCIYIDPPYNTGNEGWAYNNNVNNPEIRKWLGEVVGQAVPGLGDGFQFCRLPAEPLLNADGQIRAPVSFAQLAEFVWFVETGAGFCGDVHSSLIGVHEGRAVYLLYNGILKDRSVGGGKVLTGPVLQALPAFDGPKVIYASACRLGRPRRSGERIVFKQTPYALEG